MLTYSNEEILEITFEDVKNDMVLFHQQMNEVNAEMQGFCRGCKEFYINDVYVIGDNLEFNIEHDSLEDMQMLIQYERESDGVIVNDTLPIDINSKIELRRRNDNVVHIIM